MSASQNGTRARISVVIPVRNREQLIARAVESVAAQTLAVDEIIVVDDASTDRTVEVVNDFTRSLSNLRLVSLKENVGAAKARNVGIEMARGDLIAFLDSDDEWYVDKLSKQVKELDGNKDVVAVFCGVAAIGPGGEHRRHNIPQPRITADDLYHYNLLATMSCALILKKALLDIGGFDESLPVCEDWDLFIRLGDVGKLAVVQEVLIEYTAHGGPRLSRDKLRVLAGYDALYKKINGRISGLRLKRKVRSFHEMHLADIYCTDYGFEPLRAIKHSCRGLLLAPSREALRNFRGVIMAYLKNATHQYFLG